MTTEFSKAVQNYMAAKSLLSASKDLDRILYAREEVKKAMHELTRFQETETDKEIKDLIETILNN